VTGKVKNAKMVAFGRIDLGKRLQVSIAKIIANFERCDMECHHVALNQVRVGVPTPNQEYPMPHAQIWDSLGH
jgi:hypothetical protein